MINVLPGCRSSPRLSFLKRIVKRCPGKNVIQISRMHLAVVDSRLDIGKGIILKKILSF
jgi:hypothetical protein